MYADPGICASLQNRWFFSSWDEDVNVPVDEEEEGIMPVSGMNQELLIKAENLGGSICRRVYLT